MEKRGSDLKKKVLIITYYWPPAGGGGVMRWLKMSQYLYADTDWEPIVYTAKNAGYLIEDESLIKEVPNEIRIICEPIVEPNNFLSILGLGKFKKSIASGGVATGKSKSSLKERIILWIRSNIFIPDARFLWINPSVRRLTKLLKEEKIDAIISTGPPHSMHLIAMKLRKKFNIPWVADYRDPWTFIDFFEDLDLNTSSYNKHLKLEREVLKFADKLVTVSPSWAEEFKKRFNANFEIIYNGYDPADFQLNNDIQLDKHFSITHIGSLNKDRNTALFWEVLAVLSKELPTFKEKLKIRLIGTVTPDLKSLIESLGLENQISIESYKPHKEVVELIMKSQLLLLLINNTSNVGGIIPGKLYEYLGAQRPIICIGNPNSDSAHIIQSSNAGKVCHFEDVSCMKKVLVDYFNNYQMNQIKSSTIDVEKYSRQGEAKEYADLLNGLIKK